MNTSVAQITFCIIMLVLCSCTKSVKTYPSTCEASSVVNEVSIFTTECYIRTARELTTENSYASELTSVIFNECSGQFSKSSQMIRSGFARIGCDPSVAETMIKYNIQSQSYTYNNINYWIEKAIKEKKDKLGK